MSRVRAPTSGVSATGERGATAADPTRNLPPQPVRRRRLLSREEGGRGGGSRQDPCKVGFERCKGRAVLPLQSDGGVDEAELREVGLRAVGVDSARSAAAPAGSSAPPGVPRFDHHGWRG